MNGEEKDKEIWALYAKGVKKLAHPRPAKAPAPAKKKQAAVTKKEAERTLVKSRAVDKEAGLPARLDQHLERKLRRGTVEIEARLDLHGMYEQEAFEALRGFVVAQARRGRRYLLVITGKGREGGSVLRKNMPRWCAEEPFTSLILALKEAAPQHGGGGAWYVVLRKKREE